MTGTTDNGVITLNGVAPNATVEDNLTFDGSTLNIAGDIKIGGNIYGTNSNNIIMSDALIQSGLLFLIINT